MPFWALESESHGAGLFVGLGWSGQWNATFNSSKISSGVEIRATASLEGASFVLLPEVRGHRNHPRARLIMLMIITGQHRDMIAELCSNPVEG